jgi:hypothetical protein
MTPSGIEPVTFRFVQQCLNQLRHHHQSVYALRDGGVTAPKHVGAVSMSILILFLRQLTGASVGE